MSSMAKGRLELGSPHLKWNTLNWFNAHVLFLNWLRLGSYNMLNYNFLNYNLLNKSQLVGFAYLAKPQIMMHTSQYLVSYNMLSLNYIMA